MPSRKLFTHVAWRRGAALLFCLSLSHDSIQIRVRKLGKTPARPGLASLAHVATPAFACAGTARRSYPRDWRWHKHAAHIFEKGRSPSYSQKQMRSLCFSGSDQEAFWAGTLFRLQACTRQRMTTRLYKDR
jgi:hypothetical protein